MNAQGAVRVTLVGSAVAALLLAAAIPAGAIDDPVAQPPGPVAQVQATNVLLRPADLTGALAIGGVTAPFETGFRIPPGGQDPLPVCVSGPQYTTVQVPAKDAIGYTASSGYVWQSAYQYASAAAAQRAWSQVSADISKSCRSAWHQGSQKVTNTSVRLPSAASSQQGWAVGSTGTQHLYSALQLADDAIVMVSFVPDNAMMTSPAKAPSITASVKSEINALAGVLSQRWLQRSSAPLTQDPAITRAQTALLRPADLPATLPVTTPQRGGWSDVTADLPGYSPMTCNYRASIPKGTATYTASYGGDGGALLGEPGVAVQFVTTYASTALAQAAWARVRAAVLACNSPNPMTSASMQSANRDASGVSALTFGGVPGVWSRSLTIETDIRLVDKSYSIHLLVGSAIQTVTYVTGRRGGGSVRLDQVAVNGLAQSLATRWVSVHSAA